MRSARIASGGFTTFTERTGWLWTDTSVAPTRAVSSCSSRNRADRTSIRTQPTAGKLSRSAASQPISCLATITRSCSGRPSFSSPRSWTVRSSTGKHPDRGTQPMNLMRFLLRSSRSIVILSAIAGAAGGAIGIALIALIQRELARESSAGSTLVWAFFGLCAASASARAIAQIAMVKLGQGRSPKLGVHLVRHTLMLPLRAFETIDSSALLSALTDDIALIANAMVGLPHLCINIPIVIACLAYIGWLSPRSMACGLAFATAGDRRLCDRVDARHEVAAASSRAAGDPGRPLPHVDRRVPRAEAPPRPPSGLPRRVARARRSPRRDGEMVDGLAHFAVAEGWGQFAFFGFIGFLLFAAPQIEPISRPTLVSAVLVVLYLMTPLDIILTWVPVLGRAQVSLARSRPCSPSSSGRRRRRRPVDAEQASRASRVDLPRGRDLHLSRRRRRPGLPARSHRPDASAAARSSSWPGATAAARRPWSSCSPGLYRPESGVVRIDGRAVADADREAYRQLFSVVFADGHLFPRPPRPRPPMRSTSGPRRARPTGAGTGGLRPRRSLLDARPLARASGGGWPCSPPGSRTGPSASSTNGPPTRTRRSSRCSTTSCSPRCGQRARASW